MVTQEPQNNTRKYKFPTRSPEILRNLYILKLPLRRSQVTSADKGLTSKSNYKSVTYLQTLNVASEMLGPLYKVLNRRWSCLFFYHTQENHLECDIATRYYPTPVYLILQSWVKVCGVRALWSSYLVVIVLQYNYWFDVVLLLPVILYTTVPICIRQ